MGNPAIYDGKFLSTPSARRATRMVSNFEKKYKISIHALREEGDQARSGHQVAQDISIHALREEGDEPRGYAIGIPADFYPRPPRGGRPRTERRAQRRPEFLSTPSARRATTARARMRSTSWNFYPRPPRGGRRVLSFIQGPDTEISIHALREEGDGMMGGGVAAAI